MSNKNRKQEPDIVKREVEKGPLGREVETVEEITEVNPAECPNCGLPIEDFSELTGKCRIAGCSVEMMSSECAVETECGRLVCKNHAYPITDKLSEDRETEVRACKDHKGELKETYNLILCGTLG